MPSIITIFTPSTLLVVTPYLRQCAPPEFMPILPAMVQASWLDGIRRVEEAEMLNGGGDAEIGDAGLDADDPVRGIDFEHAVHLGDAEHDGIGGRQCAAGERGASAARHHLDALGIQEGEHGGDPPRSSRGSTTASGICR